MKRKLTGNCIKKDVPVVQWTVMKNLCPWKALATHELPGLADRGFNEQTLFTTLFAIFARP